MPGHYPLRFSAQLRQHLRALRKQRGLTQAQVGALIGVSQARIAEIEANPGLVSFEQMLQLLSALGVTLALQEEAAAAPAPQPSPAAPTAGKKPPRKPRATSAAAYGTSQPPDQWSAYRVHQASDPGQTSVPAAPGTGAPPETAASATEPRAPEQGAPTPRRNFVIRPKKGSW